jgi:hypothetical protein
MKLNWDLLFGVLMAVHGVLRLSNAQHYNTNRDSLQLLFRHLRNTGRPLVRDVELVWMWEAIDWDVST